MARSADGSADRTIAHFDQIAHDYASIYDDEHTQAGYSFGLRRRRVLELFDRPGGRVLDVGCGPGVMASAAVERGCTFWGVDPAVGMITLARERHASVARAHFTVASAEHLDFPTQTFDTVICTGVLERIADDERALQEMARVLKPEGSLLLTVPNRWSPSLMWRDHIFYPLVAMLRPIYRRLRHTEATDVIRGHRRYGRRALTRRLARLGLQVEGTSYCGYDLLPAPLNRLVPTAATRLMRFAERLSATPLRGTGAVIVVRAHRRGIDSA